jgi:hypothetical protein
MVTAYGTRSSGKCGRNILDMLCQYQASTSGEPSMAALGPWGRAG